MYIRGIMKNDGSLRSIDKLIGASGRSLRSIYLIFSKIRNNNFIRLEIKSFHYIRMNYFSFLETFHFILIYLTNFSWLKRQGQCPLPSIVYSTGNISWNDCRIRCYFMFLNWCKKVWLTKVSIFVELPCLEVFWSGKFCF